MKKILIIFIWVISVSVFAQTQNITGKITDSGGEPLPGVTIIIKGTTRGALTNFDGNYELPNVSGESILVFTYVGMTTQEIPIGKKTSVNVTLAFSEVAIDEVVVIGYGTARKSDLTGSVAVIDKRDIAASGAGSIEQAISGLVPGVVVSSSDNSPGSGLSIKVRGTGSLNASSDPLYVIDGFPFEGTSVEGGEGESVGQSPLTGINPNDIESITILKDASATAIYGARGANGVVIITTKSGKDGRLSINFSGTSGISTMIKTYEARNTKQQWQLLHDGAFPYDKRTVAPDAPLPGQEPSTDYILWDYDRFLTLPLEGGGTVEDTDWLDEITEAGTTQSYDLSVGGGTGKSNILGSIGYFKNKGVITSTDFTRVSGNFKATIKPRKSLQFNFNSRFYKTESNGAVTSNTTGQSGGGGVFIKALGYSPWYGLDSSESIDASDDGSDDLIVNPLRSIQSVDMLRSTFNSTNNVAIIFNPWKSVRIKSSVGLSYDNKDYYYYKPSYAGPGVVKGNAKITNSKTTSWLNENTISYTKKLGRHHFNVLAGFTNQSKARFSTEMSAREFDIETLGYNNIGVGSEANLPYSYADEAFLLSYLGRINYRYKDRYLVTASFRADGSSKFAENNKWGYFPSVGLAWKANEETFIKNLDVFNELNFRAGWGQTGNPNIAPYQSLTNYKPNKYPSGTDYITGVAQQNIGNTELKWEVSEQTNIGVDMSVFNQRLSLTVDAYIKTTKDLLLNGDINPSLGFRSYLYNGGEMENKGLEFALQGVIIDKSDFRWDANFNISFNKNKVKDLGKLASTPFIDVPGSQVYNQAIIQEGSPLGLWYGYKTYGLWQQDEFTWDGSKYVLNEVDGELPATIEDANTQPGSWKYKDVNGPDGVPDGKINEFDKTVIGKSQPKFTGGFNTRIQYKNIDLSIFMEGSYGRDVYNGNSRWLIQRVGNRDTGGLLHDYWRPIQYALNSDGSENFDIVLDEGNIDAKYAKPVGESPYVLTNDAYIEDGSYLRIKNVTIGYTFKDLMEINSLRVYVNVINLHTFTNYSGFDPNVNSQSKKGLRPGYDFNSYPLSRTFMMGFNVNF